MLIIWGLHSMSHLLELGIKLAVLKLAYPEKDTIQSWTVGTILEKTKNKTKQIDVVGVTTIKFTRESFHFVMYFPIWPWKNTEQLDLSSTNKCTMPCESSSFLHTTLTNKTLLGLSVLGAGF